ncbi:phosphatidate cytidylyltransferase [uncultured Eubacterium sp.]|uniref:phosphatidate cytidylyltransferase n=1 Tax=uncultured Eubacterium sp. TaxID=165185 RepID=UPI0015A97269|nr:phosphatidate cytidylyltransferase [uncultured Eubacterium sp.]
MKQRVITAAVLLALLAVVVWQIYTPLFIIVIAFLSAVASNEIMKCAKVSNKFILVFGTALGAYIPFTSSENIMSPWINSAKWGNIISFVPPAALIAVVVIAFCLAMIFDYKNTKFEDVAVSVVASVLVPYGFAMFGALRDFYGYRSPVGVYLIFYGLICALGTDTGAQLGGMAFGKHKLCPNISPKKTVEGALCGVVFGFFLNMIALLLYNRFAYSTLDRKFVLTLLFCAPFVGALSMMGDLTASVLKRNFDVKDFGKIFPGHGGVMDRFDSSLFTIPLTFVIVSIL